MPKFAANLTFLFTEVPFLDRFERAARAGFRAVEYVSPYEHAPAEIAVRLRASGLVQALFNTPAGEWARGERGLACLPGREAEFRASLDVALRYAAALDCPKLHCMAGIVPAGVPLAAAEQTYRDNLSWAAARFAAAGVQALIEPINVYDMPGYFLNSSAQAMRLIGEVGAANLRLQYDIYHMQRMGEDLAATIARLFPAIGHFQIAGNPGRTEPDRGEIDYPRLFDLIDGLGYDGWIGAEYHPVAGTESGLGWLARHHSAPRRRAAS